MVRSREIRSFLHPDPHSTHGPVGLLRSRLDLVPRLFIPRFLPERQPTRHWLRDINVRLREPHGRFRRPKAFGPL